MKTGTRLNNLVRDFVVFDLETTGFNYAGGEGKQKDYIIEVAAQRYRDFKLVAEYASYVYTPGLQVPYFITGLTGISTSMLTGAPTLDQVIKEFTAFIGDDVLIGHNVNFDVTFAGHEIHRLTGKPLANDFICTMVLAKRYVKDSANHKLGTLADHFGFATPNHRALQDVKVTGQLYKVLYTRHTGEQVPKDNELTGNTSKLAELMAQGMESAFVGKQVCVAGSMRGYTKMEMITLVEQLGGNFTGMVSSNTDIVIVGEADPQMMNLGERTIAHEKAEVLQSEGADIVIMFEPDFTDLVG